MSHEPDEKKSLLAPIADRYKPTPADFARLERKIQASLPGRAHGRSSGFGASATIGAGLFCLGLVTVGSLAYRSSSAGAPGGAPVVETAVAAEPAVVVEPPISAAPSVHVDDLPSEPHAPAPAFTSAASAPPGVSPAAGASSRRVDADDSLAREARLIAEAERAYRRGDDVRALAVLDEHARQFPHGQLADERIAERIVVLCHAGRIEEAKREARAFLRARGSDPLTRRVALSCAGSDEARER